MPQSLRQEFGHELANMVLDDIQYKRANYYYYLGGVEPWNGFGGGGTGDVPTAALLTQSDEINRKYRSEIAFAKKISPNEVTLATRKIDWVSGITYDQWDHTQEMRFKDFYVVTDQFNVYKCLDNNNNSPSTVKPTGNSIYPITLADGYIWKFLYTIPVFKRSRFTSVTYMPVQKSLSDSFYNNGAVDGAVVIEEGDGYTDQLLTTISVATNTTTGAGAVATPVIDSGGPITLGRITNVNVTNGGTGYNKGVRVVFNGTGSGAKGTAVIVGGVIQSVTIVDQGIGYDASTTISFQVGQAQLLPKVSTTNGSILGVTILDPGIGYNTAPVLSVNDSLNAGSGKYGNPTALVNCVVYEGSIKHVNIIDPGINYSADTATTIIATGDGDDAAFSPIVYDGRIVDVLVKNPGSNYTGIALTVSSATGTGAVLEGVITQADYQSDQMYIEQTAVKGAIYNIKVTNGGANYTNLTQVAITGNGTGCTAVPVISNGVIVKFQITNPGSGYTYANVVITDPGRPLIPPEDQASAYAILPPMMGHGADAPLELYSDVLAITTPLRGELEVEGVVQDFRNFGLIKNPANLITGAKYTEASSLMAYNMRLVDVTGLSKDEILVNNTNRYRVLQINLIKGTALLIPLDKDEIAPLGELASQLPTGGIYTAVETLSVLDFDKYSGTLMYISTEIPFTFAEDQSITIKTFIKF